MSITAGEVYVRAKESSPANADILPTPQEILARIDSDQQALFVTLAGVQRDRFQTTVAITSSSGAGSRTYDLSALTPLVERVLLLQLNDLRFVNQVDILDTDAEFAPRYTVRGQTLVEVASDWSTIVGAVGATLTYVFGPTPIVSSSGDFTQTISIPDQFADALVTPLKLYLFYQRPPTERTPTEEADLSRQIKEARGALNTYLENFGGIEARRFILPQPSDTGKK